MEEEVSYPMSNEREKEQHQWEAVGLKEQRQKEVVELLELPCVEEEALKVLSLKEEGEGKRL